MQAEDKANILVVDYEPAKRLGLVSVLEGLNLNIVTAESGQDALRLLLSHEYAVILMDVQMPIMDGFETAALIRSRKQSEITPIIFVTAYARAETDMLQGYALGAVDYVFTPIIPEILRAKVSVFVDLFQKTQAIKRHEEHLENLVEERTAALRESEERYHNLVEGVDAIVWEADAQTVQFTFVNRQAEILLGYPLTQWLTEPTFWVDHIHPGDRAQTVAACSAAVAQGKDHQLEYRALAADGRVVWLRDIVRVPVEPDGSVRRLRGLMVDITDLKRAEKRFQSLFEFAPDAIVIIDQQGSIVLVNRHAETVFGYQRDELLGQPVEILMPEAFRRAHAGLRQGFLESAKPRTMSADRSNLIGLRKDGTTFPADISLNPMESGGGIVVAAAVRDVTQHKRAEARIVRLSRVYSVLSGINATIVRVREPQELFDEACRIAVDKGQFTFAWIGTLDADTQQVTPVAMAGRDDGYLSLLNLTAADDAPGNCRSTAEAITQAKPVICNDIASDTDRCAMCAWHAEALSRGYRSMVVLPLMLEGKPVGVFVLYAGETGVFDEEEMRLLIEMVGDISYALGNFRLEALRKQAESELAGQFEELRRWHDATLGREMRSIELKREVNELLGQAGLPPRYPSAE